jgi:hypothetical protein
MPVHTLPAYFPYSFTKLWDGAIFKPKSLGAYDSWPDSFSFGYEIISEINTSLLADRLSLRFGRMRRDWGPGGKGASLFMNAQARPFVALEGTVTPTDWMGFSFLTGVPEYLNINGQKEDAMAWQNAFSLALVEINVNKYFHFDFGSAVIWPKRFELGYLFPVNSNFFYQNNVGDFDNLAIIADLEGRLPGIGSIWFSLFLDEAVFTASPFFHLNRNMYAYQAGAKARLPWLPFGLLTLRYTKVEPYCYTHRDTLAPWNNGIAETAYLNNGESLGYYLPPNSDEFLLRLESTPREDITLYLQYQRIRHGVEYGSGRVPGSSYWDKLDYSSNSTKYFLRDGVYQWSHVIKAGGSYSLKRLDIPLALMGELGVVSSRFTRNSGPAGPDAPYDILPDSDSEYPSSLGLVLFIGLKIFP